MKYTEDGLLKLQKTLKEILFEIDRICHKHNIKYFAIAGTLLGTIRHENMIPWDDDIDIAMLRDDYEKFLKVAKDELPSNMFCLNYNEYPKVPIYFTKICKRGTLFAEHEVYKLKYPHCVFVDLMPLDISPSDDKKRNKQLKKIRFYYELFKTKTLWKVSSISNKKKRFIGNIIRPIAHMVLFPFTKKFIYNKLMKVATKYNNLKDDAYVSYKGKVETVCPLYFFDRTIYKKFDYMQIPISPYFREMLTQEYGDYMKLPPVEKRVSHSPYQFKI